MNTKTKSKTLIVIIAILLAANIATLSFILLNKNGHRDSGKNNWRTSTSKYLKNEIGFTKEQLDRYDTLGDQHRSVYTQLLEDISFNKQAIYKRVASENFTDSSIQKGALELSTEHNRFELAMLHHIKDIRAICSPVQREIFDTGFYKLMLRRQGLRQNKRK
ncbi:MAG: hypothetical protein ABIO04_02145 [Ferruginibacter sp.]